MITECGIFGCIALNPIDIENLYYSLSEIQHRGQDSYGIIIINSQGIRITKENGLLPDYIDFGNIKQPFGMLGHMRYSTVKPSSLPSTPFNSNSNSASNSSANSTSNSLNNSVTSNSDTSNTSVTSGTSNTNSTSNTSSTSNSSTIAVSTGGFFSKIKKFSFSNLMDLDNKDCIQPIEISVKWQIFIAHNGNLPNLRKNTEKLNLTGDMKYLSDTYLFKHIWESNFNKTGSKKEVIAFIKYIINVVPGAYSCVLMMRNPSIDEVCLFGFRDRYGYKPLSIGTVDNNFCIFSESVQLADPKDYICDIEPGEIYEISSISKMPKSIYKYHGDIDDGMEVVPFFCSMEVIYFMKRESRLFNGSVTVGDFRKKIGIELAKQENTIDYMCKLREDKSIAITYIPESSHNIAIGYADLFFVKLREDLILQVDNIRSFIESSIDARLGKIQSKFTFNIEEIKKLNEIVIIDDSIVRGNTIIYIVKKLHEFNPTLKIHVRIGSPPIFDECNFGIDIANKDDLAINRQNGLHGTKPIDVLIKNLGVDSLMYLDSVKLNNIFKHYNVRGCQYCFGNKDVFNTECLDW
jgi:amidophosphoribosyltransferase